MNPASSVIRLAVVALLVSTASLTACGLFEGEDTYTIVADSVKVSAATNATQARLQFYGWAASSGCGWHDRTERRVAGDTIIWRFTGRSKPATCTQALVPLDYIDSIAQNPARTVQIRVENGNNSPLRKSFALPVNATP